MTEKQVSIIKRHIKENPNMKNSELARHMVAHSMLDLTEGSLRNYIGKVKKMHVKQVSTSKGHIMDEVVQPVKEITPHDVLIVGVNTDVHDLGDYLDFSALDTNRLVIEVGNDARILHVARAGKSSYCYSPEANSVGGLGESNAICDGVQMAFMNLLNSIEDCAGTDVNITIVTEGPEYGSRTSTIEETSEYVNKLSRSFGWCVNLVYVGEHDEAMFLARQLSIDTSNVLSSDDPDERLEGMCEARASRNKLLKQGIRRSYGTFS